MRLLDDPDELAYGDGELDLTRSEDRDTLVALVNQDTIWDDPEEDEDLWS